MELVLCRYKEDSGHSYTTRTCYESRQDSEVFYVVIEQKLMLTVRNYYFIACLEFLSISSADVGRSQLEPELGELSASTIEKHQPSKTFSQTIQFNQHIQKSAEAAFVCIDTFCILLPQHTTPIPPPIPPREILSSYHNGQVRSPTTPIISSMY